MRIGLVCKSVDPSRGGHEKDMIELIDGLVTRDHEVVVYAGDSTVPDELTSAAVEVVNVRRIPLGGALKRWSFNLFAKSTVHQHRSDLDVVFTTGKVDFGDVYRSGGGVHEVYLEQCISPVKRWLPKNLIACRLQRNLFESDIKRIIVLSRLVKQQILERFDTGKEQIEIIRNGVDTDRYDWSSLRSRRAEVRERHGFSSDDFVCLFTGGSWKRKGLPHMLDALSRIEDVRVKGILAGYTDEQRLENKLSQLGLSPRIERVGYTDELEKYYAAADALVFPSRYDAGGNVVLEALASGLPVISTSTTGFAEVIDEGENGYVVDRAEDVDHIARAIRKLRGHDDQIALRENAYELGSQFTLERQMNEMERVLNNCST